MTTFRELNGKARVPSDDSVAAAGFVAAVNPAHHFSQMLEEKLRLDKLFEAAVIEKHFDDPKIVKRLAKTLEESHTMSHLIASSKLCASKSIEQILSSTFVLTRFEKFNGDVA